MYALPKLPTELTRNGCSMRKEEVTQPYLLLSPKHRGRYVDQFYSALTRDLFFFKLALISIS